MLRTFTKTATPERVESLGLKDQLKDILEEARMVMPGLQALFGFQLIAVFNGDFRKVLSHAEQVVHLAAIGFTAVAVGLVLAPAAVHRQAEPDRVSDRLVHLASRLLTWSMIPLVAAVCLDLYLVSRVILDDPRLAAAIGSLGVLLYFGLWFLLPQARRTSAPR
jgi:hypothetical protein